jgi:hypothetical protein
MARLQANDCIAEHCLGYVLPTIQRTYNRHDYIEEKREAFEKLACLVNPIVSPDPNVLPLKARR